MALYADLNDGLYDHLAGDSALITALGGTAIYNKVIPLSADLPAVVYQVTAGGQDNVSPTESVDMTYMVKAVSDDSREAETLADLVKARLHDATITLDAPWSNYFTQMTTFIDYVEEGDDDVLYYHVGANFRVRVSG